jgi:SAM-dependent methyltransferase
VRRYWDGHPRGTGAGITDGTRPLSAEWFERTESHRYSIEPHIPEFVGFPKYRDVRLLEIGVGAGVDHLQWARAGAQCFGVDLSKVAIEITRARLASHSLHSELRCLDAEQLPFENDSFDLVYSWGVIHHADQPARIIEEIRRVLRPNGLFIGMLYNRHSLVALKLWLRRALFQAKPWRSLGDVLWHHMESGGTKGYTAEEVRHLFAFFSQVQVRPIVTAYDRKWLPAWTHSLIPAWAGWNLAIQGRK